MTALASLSHHPIVRRRERGKEGGKEKDREGGGESKFQFLSSRVLKLAFFLLLSIVIRCGRRS